MRRITGLKITDAVRDLSIKANLSLRNDVLTALKSAFARETDRRAKGIIGAIIENASVAAKEKLAICQDTGMPIVFADIGQEVIIDGDFNKAVNKGIESGYKNACLRNSVVSNPLLRGASGYTPAVIHLGMVRGNKLKLTVLPKGFGCENKSQIRMFKPTAEIPEIKKFIIETVKVAGPDACPPYVIGVGIGGTADYAGYLAKKALLRKLGSGNSKLRVMERDILKEINKLNIGPMGLGGKTTALAVNIETFPTHIAGLPVAVNVSCHALRSASAIL
ncbi:MAG: fumarate hydratase [Candidatus Omnitrophica bacterium]|nr:fumarate hydratase [Candidatus Omnitrophota bacterium]